MGLIIIARGHMAKSTMLIYNKKLRLWKKFGHIYTLIDQFDCQFQSQIEAIKIIGCLESCSFKPLRPQFGRVLCQSAMNESVQLGFLLESHLGSILKGMSIYFSLKQRLKNGLKLNFWFWYDHFLDSQPIGSHFLYVTSSQCF